MRVGERDRDRDRGTDRDRDRDRGRDRGRGRDRDRGRDRVRDRGRDRDRDRDRGRENDRGLRGFSYGDPHFQNKFISYCTSPSVTQTCFSLPACPVLCLSVSLFLSFFLSLCLSVSLCLRLPLSLGPSMLQYTPINHSILVSIHLSISSISTRHLAKQRSVVIEKLKP